MAPSTGCPVVVFDESHAETWSIDPLLAFANGPDNPSYYSFEHLARLLRETLGFEVRRNTVAPITAEFLSGISVLLIVHPADPEVHRGVGGTPVFTASEISAIEEYVSGGGGLFALSEHSTELWKSNINDLLQLFSLRFNNDVATATLQIPAGTYLTTSFSTANLRAHQVTKGAERISFFAGCTVTAEGDATPVALTEDQSQVLAACVARGSGRVCAVGDSDIFAVPYIRQHDNARFFLNIVEWLATGDYPTAPPIRLTELTTVRRPSIFLSYAHQDFDAVKQLYQSLKTLGFDVWLDKESLVPGQLFENAIKQAIKESDFFIPCFSPNSVNRRGFLQRELRLALEVAENFLDEDVYIIPVRLAQCTVEARFSAIQWVDLFEKDGLNRLVSALEYGIAQRLRS